MNMEIGKTIAKIRKAKGFTQESLANAVGVTSQAVSKWETGGSPDIELLPYIADFFGISIDKLFNRTSYDYTDIIKRISESLISIDNMEDILLKVFEYC